MSASTTRFFVVATFCGVFAVLSGCAADPLQGQPHEHQTPLGQFSVRLIDAPDDIQHLWIHVDALHLRSCTESEPWIDLPIGGAAIDLLQLSGGAFHQMVDNAAVPSGTYCELRLVLGDTSQMVTSDGKEFDVKIPSGETSGLKLKGRFDVIPYVETIVTLDFDPRESIHSAGKGGKYIMKPVIRISTVHYTPSNGEPLPGGTYLGSQAGQAAPQGNTIVFEGGAVIVFPPGAVDQPFSFTVSRWHSDNPSIVSDVFRIEPQILFAKPVMVTIPYDTSLVSPGADLAMIHDHDRLSATVQNGHTIAPVEHFSHLYDEVVEAKGKSWTDLLNPEYYYLLPYECKFPSQQAPGCAGTFLSQDIPCPGRRAFVPECTTLSYDSMPGNKKVIRAEFYLTEEEIRRVSRDDSTIEWQLKFFTEDRLVEKWTRLDTNLPGTVPDSPCYDNITSGGEDSAAVITLCPHDLSTFTKYYVEYEFEADPAILKEDDTFAQGTVADRSFVFEAVPGRLCEYVGSPTYSLRYGLNLVNCTGTMAKEVEASSSIVMDSNFSWNCAGLTGRVVDQHLEDSNGDAVNEVPFDTTVVVSNHEWVPNKDGGGVDFRRVFANGTSCTPTINVACDNYDRGAQTSCLVSGGPFAFRSSATTFEAMTTNRDELPVWLSGLEAPTYVYYSPSEISLQGKWSCLSLDDLQFAYRHPGLGCPGCQTENNASGKTLSIMDGTCTYSDPVSSTFCSNKSGWWCVGADDGRVHCASGAVDDTEWCPSDCVNMPAGDDDICRGSFCVGRTTGWWCLGSEPERVYCSNNVIIATENCAAGCQSMPLGKHDVCN